MPATHDTLIDLHQGTPMWFTALAWFMPAGVFVQFFSAGLGLFLDQEFLGVHAGLGLALSIPATGLLAGALLVRRLRGFGWWAGAVFVLYMTQVALAAGTAPLPLSLHPANGSLLLAASLVLVAKIERRRTPSPASTPAL